MKRQQDRETPPRNKRPRGSYQGHDDGGRDRLTPENDSREGRGVGKHFMGRDLGKPRHRDRDYESDSDRMPKRSSSAKPEDDPYMYSQRSDRSMKPEYEYKTLCVTSLNPQVPDDEIRDALIQEYKKFGVHSVRVVMNDDYKIAYVHFHYAEHAKEAKHSRNKLVLFDQEIHPCAVYMKRSVSPDYIPRDAYSNRGGNSPGHSMGNRRNMHHGNSAGRDMPPQREREYQNYDNYNRRQQNEQKFPHHLQHVLPEDDDKATRTLFVGNLDYNITEADIRRIFERYGVVEDIDIKRPARGQGNAYAFVKFINLDVAHRAKVEMSGQHIGKFQCKIGYGKVTPSTCLWVGGLGPWIRTETLEREFDRFGVIHRIVWPHGKNYAYVLYDSIDAAQAACQDMRGFPLGGPDKRLRVDFADASHITSQSPPRTRHNDRGMYGMQGQNYDREPVRDHGGYDNQWRMNKGFNNDNRPRNNQRNQWGPMDRDPINAYRNPDNPRDFYDDRPPRMESMYDDVSDRWRRNRTPQYDDQNDNRNYYRHSRTPEPPRDYQNMRENRDRNNHPDNFHEQALPPYKRRRGYSPEGNGDLSYHFDKERTSETDHSRRTKVRGNEMEMRGVEHVENVVDLAKCLPSVWNGALVLKNSAFPARLHHVSGDVTLVDTLMRDPMADTPTLRITQRLRLDQPKLEEVGRRVSSSGTSGHAVLLAMPGPTHSAEEPNSPTQQRPLRNLVTYLKQKEAAGVISLPPTSASKDKENVGVLHAFPPCQFGHDFLRQRAPKLSSDPSKDDHLVVVVVRGA